MNKRKNWKPVLLAAAMVLLLVSIPVFAALNIHAGPEFSIRAVNKSACAGDEVRVQLTASPGRTAAGAFRCSLQYDATAFEYVTKEDAPQIQGADLFVRQANPLISVYTCDTQQGSAAVLSGEVTTYLFRVRQDAEPGTYTFSALTDEVCDFDGKSLPDSENVRAEVQVASAESKSDSSSSASQAQSTVSASEQQSTVEPRLTALLPEDDSLGQLKPAFRSEVTSYQITVPETCTEIWFQTQQPDGVAVTVSRHTLQAVGNDTVITITVKTVQKNTQKVYTVIVHREHRTKSAASSTSTPQADKITVAVPAETGLTPAFSPNIRDYEMTVPAVCSEVYLHTDTAAGTAVTANRHTLLPAGNDTVITLTITASDEKSKSQYRFVVHRLAAPKSVSFAAGKIVGKTKTVSKSSTKKAATGKSSSHKKVTSVSGRKKASSKATMAGKSAKAAASEEAYTPAAIPTTAAAQKGGLTVTGNEGFTGFQTGVLVVLLTASAAVAAILGTRAYCRKTSGAQQTSEDESNPDDSDENPEKKS